MRFMMLIIPAVYQGDEGKKVGTNFAPNAEAVEKMMKFNEELAKTGTLISLDGLHPPATGARVSFTEEKRALPMERPWRQKMCWAATG